MLRVSNLGGVSNLYARAKAITLTMGAIITPEIAAMNSFSDVYIYEKPTQLTKYG